MKNVRSLNRKELKAVLGGFEKACEPPIDGVCKTGYASCDPYCCFRIIKPHPICSDW